MKNCIIILILLACVATRARADWVQSSNGMAGELVSAFAVTADKVYAAGILGVYVSTNDGDQWTKIVNGLSNSQVKTLLVAGDRVYAGTNGDGVYVTGTGESSNWTQSNSGLTNKYVRCLAVNGSSIYAGTSGSGIFVSNDNGSGWSLLSSELDGQIVISIAFSGDYIYAGTDGFGIFVSADKGGSWKRMENYGSVNALYAEGNLVIAGADIGIFCSTDKGTTWTQSAQSGNIRSLVKCGDKILGAFADNNGVMMTTDMGASWGNIGMKGMSVYCMTVKGDMAFAGTWGYGVYRSNIADIKIGVREYKDLYPAIKFYPNPAVDYITIELAEAASESADISIFDMLGRHVMSSTMDSRSLRIDIGQLSAGTYSIVVSGGGGEPGKATFVKQ